MRSSRPTPKVFFSSYQPPKPKSGGSNGQLKQLVIVAIIVIGGYLLTRLPIFQIKSVVIEGAANPTTIEKLQSLTGRSILSSAVADLTREIMAVELEILDIDCDKGIPNTVRCRVTERSPKFAWRTNGKSYLLDETGVTYKEGEPSAEIPAIDDRANLAVELGAQVISSEIVDIYLTIGTALAEKGFVLGNYYVTASPLHPGALVTGRNNGSPFSAGPIEVQFSVSYPISYQVNLLSGLFESKAAAITSRVDLRTPGYLYFK